MAAKDCEWMFDDTGIGPLTNMFASFNPARWSGSLSFEKGIKQLEEVQRKGQGNRPVTLKIPSGVFSKEQTCKNVQEAIAKIKHADPKRQAAKAAQEASDKKRREMARLQAAADKASDAEREKILVEKAKIAEEQRQLKKEALDTAKVDLAEQEAGIKDATETLEAATKVVAELAPAFDAARRAQDEALGRLATQREIEKDARDRVVDLQAEVDGTLKDGTLIFQLGTNNWQRPKNDGSGELEFAPGSGVLHEAHHNAYNQMKRVKCYSMYPSKQQNQPSEEDADYRVFQLNHDIPICESASPNSSKRWHGFSEEEFEAYVQRLENEVYLYTKYCEAVEGKKFTMFIAHHAFVNPLVLRRVIQRRVKDGEAKIPLYCFVHGTALKMYRWEIAGKSRQEFPMRFHKMIVEEKLFNDIEDGVDACFVISDEQRDGIKEIFPTMPPERVIVAPNGINVDKFRPREKTLHQVVHEQTRSILWPAAPSEEDCKKYTKLVAFVGKAAEWKRQAALLHAAAAYEKTFPDLITLCVGTGPEDELQKIKGLCAELGLKNTFLLGPRDQDVLAEIYTVANVGCFPSFREPFGLVFVECMACRTPVIGADSGGPKDFVNPSVGELVPEPPETTDLASVSLGVKTLSLSLNEAITRCIQEDWKTTMGEACIQLAHTKFTVGAQVELMLDNVNTFHAKPCDSQ